MDERELYFRIERLFAEYCACLDEDRLEDWPALFVEDGLYRMLARENHEHGYPIPLLYFDSRGMMIDRIQSLRHANIFQEHHYRHALSGVRVTARTDAGIEVTSSYIVVQTLLDGETRLYQAGSYRDVLVETADGLKFRERTVIYDTSRVQTLLATPV